MKLLEYQAKEVLASLGIASLQDFNRLQNQINDLAQEDRRLRAGVAMAGAIPQALVLPGEVFTINVDDFDATVHKPASKDEAAKIAGISQRAAATTVAGSEAAASGSTSAMLGLSRRELMPVLRCRATRSNNRPSIASISRVSVPFNWSNAARA